MNHTQRSTVRTLADLGTPPNYGRAAWVREQFVAIGRDWYATDIWSDHASELEDLAVEFMIEHRDILPSLSTLKRAVANWSFLPSVVDRLWMRAFPPSVEEQARASTDAQFLNSTANRLYMLRREGKEREAEALRTAAVTFFNKYLPDTEVGAVLRADARRHLRKP